jgi:hypothetical protein
VTRRGRAVPVPGRCAGWLCSERWLPPARRGPWCCWLRCSMRTPDAGAARLLPGSVASLTARAGPTGRRATGRVATAFAAFAGLAAAAGWPRSEGLGGWGRDRGDRVRGAGDHRRGEQADRSAGRGPGVMPRRGSGVRPLRGRGGAGRRCPTPEWCGPSAPFAAVDGGDPDKEPAADARARVRHLPGAASRLRASSPVATVATRAPRCHRPVRAVTSCGR